MSAHEVSENVRAPVRSAQPLAGALSIADPVPVGITNAAVLWVFVTLTATYLLLVLAEFGVATSSLQPIAGYVGITCGVTAWYVAFAHVANATFGRELIPTWPLNRTAIPA
jgi:hypothetical protein